MRGTGSLPVLGRMCKRVYSASTRPWGKVSRAAGRYGIHPCQNDGFTLVEVLAALLLYTVLIGSVFSLYLFGVNAYQTGAARLDLQQNVRLAVDFISRELRYANELEIVSAEEIRYRYPGEPARYTLKYKNSEIVHLRGNVENKVAYSIKTLSFDWDEEDKLLYFNIKGTDNNGYTYVARSAVCLQNLRERW